MLAYRLKIVIVYHKYGEASYPLYEYSENILNFCSSTPFERPSWCDLIALLENDDTANIYCVFPDDIPLDSI